jgi:hypothetical protein
MSELVEVTISGTVGKQTYATTVKKILKQVILTPSTSAAMVTIRDGNASGDTRLVLSHPASDSVPVMFSKGVRFDRGMHVKVLGSGGKCYLEIE